MNQTDKFWFFVFYDKKKRSKKCNRILRTFGTRNYSGKTKKKQIFT